MRAFYKRLWFWSLLVPALLIGAAGAFYLAKRPSADRRAFGALLHEWDGARRASEAGSPEEKAAARKEYQSAIGPLAERCLELADQYPNTTGEVAALLLAAKRAPDTPAGKEALDRLVALAGTADIEHLSAPLDWVPGTELRDRITPLAPALLARARRDADHPKAPRLLAAVCTITQPVDEPEAPATFTEAADLIAEKYAASPEISHFCECLNSVMGGDKPWAGRYERHLRAVLEANEQRKVRCAAALSLAAIVQSAGEDRQAEAEALYEKFLEEFDGKRNYDYQQIEGMYRDLAKGQLDEVRHRAAGRAAPEIDGADLDGKPMRLSEHRGRVVLLNFWATTCFPCMKLVPHERELVARMAGKPFVLLGVNGDDAVETAKKSAAKHKMSWRSFQDKRAAGQPISDEWKVLGLPTLYLIDEKGMIRKRWIGAPPPEELGREVDRLVEQASRKG